MKNSKIKINSLTFKTVAMTCKFQCEQYLAAKTDAEKFVFHNYIVQAHRTMNDILFKEYDVDTTILYAIFYPDMVNVVASKSFKEVIDIVFAEEPVEGSPITILSATGSLYIYNALLFHSCYKNNKISTMEIFRTCQLDMLPNPQASC